MNKLFHINKSRLTPIYQQLINSVITGIEKGIVSEGGQLPSINQVSKEHKLARETVVKAFKILQQKGIIRAVHGKGFFVASCDVKTQHRVFVLFDTFSAYKEVLYNAIKKGFGNHAFLDIYFHHFNIKLIRKLLEEAAENYTSYIIWPPDHVQIPEILELLPEERVFIIDNNPQILKNKFPGVYQDFSYDVCQSLSTVNSRLSNYHSFTLVFRNTITEVPSELRMGFEKFCQENAINYSVVESLKGWIPKKGEAFLIIDDEDLVTVVEQAKKHNLKIGEDLGIISYNETSLKKIVAGGISVISTDFAEMGVQVTKMIIEGTKTHINNPCHFINRGSF